jgi:hypothetical protein
MKTEWRVINARSVTYFDMIRFLPNSWKTGCQWKGFVLSLALLWLEDSITVTRRSRRCPNKRQWNVGFSRNYSVRTPCWENNGMLTYLYLLTCYLEYSPSWQANRFAASQETPLILWNPKVHYRIHNFPPPVSKLSQPNSVHTPTSHFLKIHSNIIFPSMPGSPKWSVSLRFPHHNPIHASLLPHPRYMPRPVHARFYHPHNIGWGVMACCRG